MTIRLNSTHMSQVREEAARRQLDVSDIIREALAAWIAKHDHSRN